jgi:hypothetical protein
MAPQWTFDPELLKQLIVEHPDWSNPQIAEVLTADNAKHGRPAVDPARVASAKNRLKARWAAEGVKVRSLVHRSELVSALTRNTGITIPDERMKQDHVYIRYLRVLDRLREGLPVKPPEMADRARRFERALRQDKRVVDLREDGEPFLRAAAPWELDSRNELISLVASYRPPEARHAV